MNKITYTLVPWSTFKDLIITRFNINFYKIDDMFIHGAKWNYLEDWLEVSDLEILHCLECLKPFTGELLVVTDASYEKGLSPFIMNSKDIKQFVESHSNNFKQRFLETDVLIINLELKIAWIFHHEGVYGLVEYE